LDTHRNEPAAPVHAGARVRSAKSELEWIAAREAAAREDIRKAVVGLGRDLGTALHIPSKSTGHPLVRIALERTGEALGSDLVLDRVENMGIRIGARAMARSGAMAAASTWLQDLFENIGHSQSNRSAASRSSSIDAHEHH
jgi:hypothetical protein